MLCAGCPICVANHALTSSEIDPSGLAVEAGDEENDEDEWTRILKNYKPGSNDKAN